MKKVLFILFLLSASTLLMAQNADFFELPFSYNTYLYPDYQYFVNPAIANRLERPIDTYNGYFYFDRNAAKAERTVDGPGTSGGYNSSSTTTFDTDFHFGRFNKDDTVSRIGAEFLPYIRFSNSKTVDYNASGEDVKTNSLNFEGTLNGNYLSSWKQDDLNVGLYGGLWLNWDPKNEEFTWTTDKAQNGGKAFISSAPFGGSRATFKGHPYLIFGIVKTVADTWYSLGGSASLDLEDTSRQLTAVDTNADGFDDKIVTMKEQQTSTAAWGAGLPYYDDRRQTWRYTVSLYPSMIKPLKEGNDLILSGRLDLLDLKRDVSFTHTADTDQSKTETLTGSYGTSGSFLAGIRKKTDFGAEFRYGAYTNFDVNFESQDSVDNAGADNFDSRNTHHYNEVNWGADPDNGDVTNFGSVPFTINADLGAVFGLQWRVSPEIVFFGSGSATVNFNYKKYAVFDTATGKVWTEWTMKNTLGYSIGGDFGLQFQLPKGPFITVSGVLPTLLRGTTSDNYLTFDPLPSGSTNVTSDKSLSDGEGFTVTVKVTVRR